MNELILILTVGLPRSGKSTWAKKQGMPIVNPDSIRLALHGHRFLAEAEPYVWAITYTMVESLFLAGHERVVVDATNITNKRRQPFVDKFDKKYRICYKVFDTSISECIQRADKIGDKEIIPIIERMASNYEPVEDSYENL